MHARSCRFVALTMAFLALAPWPSVAQPNPAPPGPAYLLLEIPSMRVVAQSRRDVLTARLAPGSVMKAFALAAAMESRVADANTRVICRRTANLDGKTMTCVHPDLHRALGPDEALSYSCNVFFATIARRLSRQAFDDVLVRVGLPPSDAAVPIMRAALGIEGVRATPRDLLEAFLRLTDTSRTPLRLGDETRRVLRLGLESAARTGTASALWENGYSALAKTGTAPMPGGGSFGIVVAVVHTELPSHAIVVVAPGTSGANAARLAAEILARHGVPRRPGAGRVPAVVTQGTAAGGLRVGRAGSQGAYRVATLSIENYVAQAVAGEGGDTLPPAALAALAVTVRTFALHNRGRHEQDGFDLCDLTHCQALRPASDTAKKAASQTAGLVLRVMGEPADVYLSAACGGHTEKPSAAWRGAADPPHLPARPDGVCVNTPSWVSTLSEVQARRVLEAAGLRGTRIDGLRVATRSASGRAATIAVTGMVPESLDAGVFHSAAGRVLGWQSVKSTLFNIERTSGGYRLTGRGHGHGVGLCVAGAVARANAGAETRAILAAYFPGAELADAAGPAVIRVRLPETERDRAPSLRIVVDREMRALSAKLGVSMPPALDVVFHPTVESYTRTSKLPWWTAARTTGTRIDLVPLAGLAKRGIVESTLRHELVHVLTDTHLADRPLWVREGLAVVMAGESTPVANAGPLQCPSDAELRDARSTDAWRRAYEMAGRCVTRALATGVRWRDLR